MDSLIADISDVLHARPILSTKLIIDEWCIRFYSMCIATSASSQDICAALKSLTRLQLLYLAINVVIWGTPDW